MQIVTNTNKERKKINLKNVKNKQTNTDNFFVNEMEKWEISF